MMTIWENGPIFEKKRILFSQNNSFFQTSPSGLLNFLPTACASFHIILCLPSLSVSLSKFNTLYLILLLPRDSVGEYACVS